VGLAGIGLAAFHAINPSLLQSMLGRFSIFAPGGAWLTIMEVQPLLFPNGSFSFQMAWYNFGASFFIALVSIAMLIYVAIKDKSADKTLFLVWSIIMLIAVLGQRRFGYYYAVNVALLTGYFSWKMLDLAGLRKLLAKPKEVVGVVKKFRRKEKKAKEKAKPKTFMQPRGAWVRVIVVGIVIFFVAFFPNIPMAKALAGSPGYVMDEGWYTSLLWLRDNSPDPFEDFNDPDFYYRIYKTPFQYPESAYGVMSWWDYGYFIMQIAHRIPNANPGQGGAKEAGQFFTAQNESSANELADRLGTKYVMIDYAMATPSKFYAMAEWAGSNSSEFYEIYYVQTSTSGGQWAYLYYPAYYNSTVVRLYNFDGKAVTPTQSLVISYEETEYQGQKYKEVTSGQPFSSYEDAQAYVANQTSGNYRIVGVDPFSSPVPLEKLNSYKLVYPPEATANITATNVKIFEYLGSSQS
jgi:dolichyl-diphosphooligosaccharide--protein glycosyltransferase